MATRKTDRRRGPAFRALGEGATRYNETDVRPAKNLLPQTRSVDLLALARAGSQAAVRLYVEEALMQRCGLVPAERWTALQGRAAPALLRLLADGTARVELRQRAIVELTEMRAASALGAVSTVLLDPAEDTITRVHAARAIGLLGEAAGIGPLVRAAAQAEPVLRRQVALALGRFEDVRAVRGLLRLVADDDREVARVAQAAVAQRSKALSAALKGTVKPIPTEAVRARRTKAAPLTDGPGSGRVT